MPDDSATVLRQALEEASRLRRENATLATQNRERTTQLFGEAGARIAAQDSAIDSAISAAEQEHATNQSEWERLQGEGDFKGAGAAMAKMIDASTRMANLRSQKDQVALQRANLERSQTQDAPSGGNQQQPDPLEGMNERERQWVAEHPAFLSDPDFASRARGAASYATNTLKFARDSEQYIDFINRTLSNSSAPATSISTAGDLDQGGGDHGAPDVMVPRMPQPEVPRPVPQNPDDPAMQVATQMVDDMYPQTRAIGNGGAGIRNIAAPPSRVIRQLSDSHRRGQTIEPTPEEVDTALRLIPDILGAEGAAMSNDDKIRTYYAWYHAPSSQRKLRRWYGRDATAA